MSQWILIGKQHSDTETHTQTPPKTPICTSAHTHLLPVSLKQINFPSLTPPVISVSTDSLKLLKLPPTPPHQSLPHKWTGLLYCYGGGDIEREREIHRHTHIQWESGRMRRKSRWAVRQEKMRKEKKGGKTGGLSENKQAKWGRRREDFYK